MNKASDAADRFFERYSPGPMDILLHCCKWLLSEDCESALMILLIWSATTVAVFQIDYLISVVVGR